MPYLNGDDFSQEQARLHPRAGTIADAATFPIDVWSPNFSLEQTSDTHATTCCTITAAASTVRLTARLPGVRIAT